MKADKHWGERKGESERKVVKSRQVGERNKTFKWI